VDGARLTEPRMRLGLTILGVAQLAIGIWLAIDPNSFVDEVAAFGPADDHFLRDIATFQIAFGVALLIAVGRPGWRAGVLLVCVVQGVLHTFNHLIDIGGTDPAWQGYFNFFSLLAQTALFAYLFRESVRAEPARRHAPRATGRMPA
jgi:uncharacterized membrane protein